jgi:hypothetical protein
LYSKLHSFHRSLIALALSTAAGLTAMGQAPAQQAPAQNSTATAAGAPQTTGTLRGHIADPTGALIPGAKVTVSSSNGKPVASATADSAGAYSISGLPRRNIN